MKPQLDCISINGLSKSYKNIKALDNVSFTIPIGSIFALLGPNGSGKSTLIKILARLIRDWKGSILFNGNSINQSNDHLNKFGFIVEDPCFYEYLSAKKNLEIFSRLTGTSFHQIEKVLELVDLRHRSDDKVAKYSYGMKQRLGIAQALLHDPKILVLDEPTNGLDPLGVNSMADLIFRLNQAGKTICISTHSLIEVDRICSHVAILKKGKLLVTKEINLLEEDGEFFRLEVFDLRSAVSFIKTFDELEIISQENNIIIVKKNISDNSDDFNSMIGDQRSIKSFHKESNLIQYFYD
tara:strand:+ start:1902 stop:2789 length:888 start_codon:yes stop_codon:yes gene_type:complete